MGFEKRSGTRTYDLGALGLLEGPSLKAASIVTEKTWESLPAASVAFFVFDDETGEIVVHAAARRLKTGMRFPLHSSALWALHGSARKARLFNLADADPTPAEFVEFGLPYMLAAPVFGPDNMAIGALAAFDVEAGRWSRNDHTHLEDMAYLVTQEVMLRASLATLHLMAKVDTHFNA